MDEGLPVAGVRQGRRQRGVVGPYSTVLADVPQPEITSRIAGAAEAAQEREYDAQSGNLSTVAVDATVATAGPRTQPDPNVQQPRPAAGPAFGAGWTTRYDMRLTAGRRRLGQRGGHLSGRPGGAVRPQPRRHVRRAVRSGRPPSASTGGAWTLADRAGVTYAFDSGGRLIRITDNAQRSVVLSYDLSGKLTKAQVSNSQSNPAGRALRFTWTGTHITKVTTDLNTSWDYTYSGDVLTKVCAPARSAPPTSTRPGRTTAAPCSTRSPSRTGASVRPRAATPAARSPSTSARTPRSTRP